MPGTIKGLKISELITIKNSEAVNHVEEKVEVRGGVSEETRDAGGNIVILLSGRYPNQAFTVLVSVDSKLAHESAFLKSLIGRNIKIAGVIISPQGRPACTALDKDQIKIEN